ncbi:uncharacterized protein E0L32_002477 [Thyridium curvatum]|uniref:Alcohol acetyltransferase n=1 Tax=Thyridium curvatum TaxID=1093900 RepID=A0A507BPD7_9PEZI|nr:uncharacterized protein E0L32_002477 [Thyridium curvatum]TPX18620.1 hypothetical protein E0L32_002477 [Thyridium curvatum]
MYLLDQYRGTCLSCRYTIPTHLAPADSRARLQEAFKGALVDTIMRHPALQVGMEDVNAKVPSWIQLQSLDLAQHITWVSIDAHDDFEQTVQQTICTQLDDRFPDPEIKLPNWKVTILRQEDDPAMEVLLTWNHPQFDGAGARVIHEDLLRLLNAQDGAPVERTSLDGDILTLPSTPLLLPAPLEVVKSMPVDIKFLAKAFWEDIQPQFLNRDISLATWCPIRSTPYKTQYRAFFVDRTALGAILALCRQHKTTITGLINGLALIAFSSRLDSNVAQAFQSSTCIDHRRNMPPPPPEASWGTSDRAVGNYVTQLPHVYDTNLVALIRSMLPADAASTGGLDLSADLQRELWAVSAQNRLEIVQKLEDGLRNDIVGLFKYVGDWKQTMRGMAKKKRQFTWLVTNIGVLDGGGGKSGDADRSQRWSIERAQFGLSAEIPAAAIEFAPVSVAGGAMCVGAQWPDCAVDVTFGDAIMADLERWLGQLAREA